MLRRRRRIRKGAWSLAFIAAFLAGQMLEPADASFKKCNKICGNVEEDLNARDKVFQHEGIIDEEEEKVADDRIVHGYTPKDRGFMVLIRSYWDIQKLDESNGCTGSIVNNRFVLTAGHCVCLNGQDTSVPCEDNKPTYDLEMMKVFIGLRSTTDIKKHDSIKKHEKAVKEIIIHPRWNAGESTDGDGLVDMALIKLKKKIVFDEHVMPVCLPFKPTEPYGKGVYVAGWGLTEKDQVNCYTDNRGPERVRKCRFPFLHEMAGDDEEFDECQKQDKGFPSNGNKKCRQFNEANPDFDWKKNSFITIKYNRGKSSTNCYTPIGVEKYGWCGTCVEGAKEGEEGHCPAEMSVSNLHDRDEEERTVATEGKNWGYCNKECANTHLGLADRDHDRTLQETYLKILTKKECTILQGRDKHGSTGIANTFNPETEYCAGLKQPFGTIQVFNRSYVKKVKGKRTYKFKKIGNKVDNKMVKRSHRKLDFYISFSDSCNGDSGGPLFRFEGKKAYQYGVVSRGGEDCAGFNQPGLYTSVDHKPHLDWIVENTKSGKC